MTYAPARLLEARRYLMPATGITDFRQMGIVGDEDHNGGYHHGWDDRRASGDYSWTESARDSSHRTDAARALDIGQFARLRELSNWLARECAANTPDTRDIREIIYSPDGRTVRRWDRLGRRTSGDNSHLTHTHISYFADAEDRDKTAVFRRFFGGDDVDAEDVKAVWRYHIAPPGRKGPGYNMEDHVLHGEQRAHDAATGIAAVSAKIDALAIPAPAPVDPAAIRAVVEPLLEAMEARLAARVPTAEQIADKLAARLAS